MRVNLDREPGRVAIDLACCPNLLDLDRPNKENYHVYPTEERSSILFFCIYPIPPTMKRSCENIFDSFIPVDPLACKEEEKQEGSRELRTNSGFWCCSDEHSWPWTDTPFRLIT